MKKPVQFVALAACLLGMAACRSARPVEESAPTAAEASNALASQQAPQALAVPAAPKGKSSLSVPVAEDSPFVPKNPGLRISRVNVPERLVALTFDDGPHGKLTPRILDILARYGAKGTFFVLGQNASRFPGVLQRAAAEGHEIGNHTWSHAKLTSCGREKLLSEMSRTRDAVIRATGQAPAVMRPPYGAINAATIQTIYSAYGTPAILWDVDTNDWRKPGVQTVVNRAVNGARSGSIILVHDIHASTAEAIEGIVQGLQARGFRLVTVSELIAAARRASGGSAPAAAIPSETAVPAPSVRTAPASAPMPAPASAVPSPAPSVSELPELPSTPAVRQQPATDAPYAAIPAPGAVPTLRDPALPALRLRTPSLSPFPAEPTPRPERHAPAY